MHAFRHVLTAVVSSVLCLQVAGCAFSVQNAPVNQPPQAHGPAPSRDIVQANAIAVSLSGGGTRAAAFGLGVLQGLRAASTPQDDLVDDITFMSSVSGGSLLAAYYGLHGRSTLDEFQGAVLERNMELGMQFSAFRPDNIARFVQGGLNDRRHLSTYLDDTVFKRATFADMWQRRRPDIWINATDLYNRIPFPFIPPVFAAVCSDLASFPVAEAVSASMAVPVVFAPVVLQTYPTRCAEPLAKWVEPARKDPGASKLLSDTAKGLTKYRAPSQQKFIKLVDGGVTDNFGLSSLLISRAAATTPYGPFTQRDAVRMRRMLFLVVDAGRGVSGDWALNAAGPSGLNVAVAATDTAIDASARLSFESFLRLMQDWQRSLVSYRCKLPRADVERLLGAAPGAGAATDNGAGKLAAVAGEGAGDRATAVAEARPWQCDDVHFDVGLVSFSALGEDREAMLNAIPTSLQLPNESLKLLIEAGRDAVQSNPAFLSYQTRGR